MLGLFLSVFSYGCSLNLKMHLGYKYVINLFLSVNVHKDRSC